MNTARWIRWGVLVVVGLSLGACSTLGFHKRDKAEAGPVAQTSASAEVVAGPMTKEQAETELRGLVSKEMAAAAREERDTVHKRRPYYFKFYSEYPDSQDIAIDFQERDSQTAPYAADATVAVVRYGTRFHRKRDEAVTDQNFLRDTGHETISYEFRNGRWIRLGSLFHAEKVEENVNGEWLPVREEIKSTVAAQEEDGGSWFGRTWSAITGR